MRGGTDGKKVESVNLFSFFRTEKKKSITWEISYVFILFFETCGTHAYNYCRRSFSYFLIFYFYSSSITSRSRTNSRLRVFLTSAKYLQKDPRPYRDFNLFTTNYLREPCTHSRLENIYTVHAKVLWNMFATQTDGYGGTGGFISIQSVLNAAVAFSASIVHLTPRYSVCIKFPQAYLTVPAIRTGLLQMQMKKFNNFFF